MRLLPICCLLWGACASPVDVTHPLPTSTDSATVAVEAQTPPVELLRDGEVLFDREPPPFPESLRVDWRQKFEEMSLEAAKMISTEAYGIDSLGQEVPLKDALREATAEMPNDAQAFVQFMVAWDGTPYRAWVIRVRGRVPASTVRESIARIRFRPTRIEYSRIDIPRGTPIPFGAYISIPFSRSGLD